GEGPGLGRRTADELGVLACQFGRQHSIASLERNTDGHRVGHGLEGFYQLLRAPFVRRDPAPGRSRRRSAYEGRRACRTSVPRVTTARTTNAVIGRTAHAIHQGETFQS